MSDSNECVGSSPLCLLYQVFGTKKTICCAERSMLILQTLAGWRSGKALHVYSGGTRVEAQTGHRLSWLKSSGFSSMNPYRC
jgi:hypothetical protein